MAENVGNFDEIMYIYENFDYCNWRKIAGTEETDRVNYGDMHSKNF